MSNTVSRRNFLRSTLFTTAGAALASGAVSPMLVLGDESANEKINTCIVGVRGRGGEHIQGYIRNRNTVITYIVDADEVVGNSRCDQIAKTQGSRPKFVRDMRDAFADADVDIVSTATPNFWHGLTAVWAMQAGKDVYVEKPASQNLFEGKAMVAAAKKYGRICQVGTQCRSNPAIREGMKFIHDGNIGEVKFARGLCHRRRKSIGALGDYAIPDSVDFNLWSGPCVFTEPKCTRPSFHYDWHWQRHYGNGDSGNQGPHQFDIARFGLQLNTHPKSVITYGGRLGYDVERKDPNYVDAGDTANIEVSIFDFGDKTLVFETRNLETAPTDGAAVGVVFYGSEGRLVQVNYGLCVAYDLAGNVVKEFKGGSDQMHFDNFVEAVQKRDVSILNAPIWEGHMSAALAHFGNASYYLGGENRVSVDELSSVLKNVESRDDNQATLQRTVEHLEKNGVDLAKTPLSLGPQLAINPEKECFADESNVAAAQWLTREWRAGFVCPSADEV